MALPNKCFGVDSLVDLMSRLPVSELGSDAAIGAFIMFSGQFTFLKQSLNEYIAGPFTDEVKAEIAKLDDREYPGEWKKIVDTKRAVLKSNVQVHIDRIHIEFKTLMKSFP